MYNSKVIFILIKKVNIIEGGEKMLKPKFEKANVIACGICPGSGVSLGYSIFLPVCGVVNAAV